MADFFHVQPALLSGHGQPLADSAFEKVNSDVLGV